MAKFIARRIMDGTFDYETIFSFQIYKKYKDDVDEILRKENYFNN